MVSVQRALLLASTTLAASRHSLTPVDPPPEGYCGRDTVPTLAEQCRPADAAVRPEHVLFPLLLPCCVVLVVNVPTLVLASRFRTRQLRVATAHVAAAWAAIAACAYAYLSHPALAYALALHSTVFLLTLQPDPGVLLGRRAEHTVRRACTAALLLGAWLAGPPLPLVDVPGLSRCCGSVSHLAGLLLPDAAMGLTIELVHRLLAV
jgi:hypothetical protein